MPEEALSTEDRITRDMLRIVAELAVEEDDQGPTRSARVDQIGGPQVMLPQLSQFQPADTPERLEALLDRLRAYGPYMDATIEILHEGRASGRTAPRIVAERTIEQLEPHAGHADRGGDRPLDVEGGVRGRSRAGPRRRPRRRLSGGPPPPRDARGRVPRGHPGGARAWSAPNGDALYRHPIKRWTTLDLDPHDVHQIGLEELEQIDEERRTIARRAGFGDDTDAYRAALGADPANHAATKDELVARANEDIERAAAVAPSVFGRLPRAGCEVRPVEEFKEKDAPFAYYYPPTLDGSRPGIYYVNGYDLPSRKYSKLASTTYHEAIPGHHFQISLEMEHPNLNTFRRLGSRMVGGAYVEGWGLYSERLADEMGLYRNDAERFGMLDAQAWRASRLVVDTGMHALRWPRQRSIDWLLRTGLSETDAVIETDRYITWPGQALTYMIGMREIERLRRELEARDGDRFDLLAFHDQLIGHGSLPLATLAAELPRWVGPEGSRSRSRSRARRAPAGTARGGPRCGRRRSPRAARPRPPACGAARAGSGTAGSRTAAGAGPSPGAG